MRPIGIFDSGVGGLGIFQLVAKKLPFHDLVYIADNANLPFGEKTTEQLHAISENIVRFFVEKHNVEMVVIACNTATVSSIDYLRQRFSVPIVGAVPVVKPSCELTKNNRVALLATPATIQSDYLNTLIEQYAHESDKLIEVIKVPCPGLADMIDTGNLDSPEITHALKKFLAPALAHNVDVIGLGCTQYPFVREQIKKLIPSNITLLDSNEAVAKQVERVITTQPGYTIDRDNKPVYTFYATKNAPAFYSVAQKLIGRLVTTCQSLKLD